MTGPNIVLSTFLTSHNKMQHFPNTVKRFPEVLPQDLRGGEEHLLPHLPPSQPMLYNNVYSTISWQHTVEKESGEKIKQIKKNRYETVQTSVAHALPRDPKTKPVKHYRKKTAVDRSRTDRISLTHDLDLDL